MPIDFKSCSPNEEVPISDVFNLHVFINSLIINNNLFYWTYVLLLFFYRVRIRRDLKMERVLTTTQSTLSKKLLMSNPSHFQICGEILHLLTKLVDHFFFFVSEHGTTYAGARQSLQDSNWWPLYGSVSGLASSASSVALHPMGKLVDHLFNQVRWIKF